MKSLITIFISVITSVLIGMSFLDVAPEIEEVSSTYGNLIAFQIGAYKDEESAKEIALQNKGIVINEKEYYYVIIGILSNTANIDRLMSILDNNGTYYYAKVIQDNGIFKNILYQYEELMKECTSDVAFLKLVEQSLKEYEVSYEN